MAADEVQPRVRDLRPQPREGPQQQRPVLALPLAADEEEAGRLAGRARRRLVVGPQPHDMHLLRRHPMVRDQRRRRPMARGAARHRSRVDLPLPRLEARVHALAQPREHRVRRPRLRQRQIRQRHVARPRRQPELRPHQHHPVGRRQPPRRHHRAQPVQLRRVPGVDPRARPQTPTPPAPPRAPPAAASRPRPPPQRPTRRSPRATPAGVPDHVAAASGSPVAASATRVTAQEPPRGASGYPSGH